MTKPLRQDEIDKMPEDGVDFRYFILQVASNNNWVFDLDEYRTAIVNAKKGALGRIDTALKELEFDNFVIKYSSRKSYSVTSNGIEYFKSGKTTKETNNSMQINANNVVFAGGDISAPISQANDHSLSEISNNAATIKSKQPIIKRVIKFVFWFAGGIVSIFGLYELIKSLSN